MTEEQTLIEEIQALNLKREKLKADLRDKVAEQAVQKERWVLYGESTTLAERLSLQADIDVLEADRQRTKVDLMLLKQEAREMGYKNWEQLKSDSQQAAKLLQQLKVTIEQMHSLDLDEATEFLLERADEIIKVLEVGNV
jgi:hypothetical protein